MSKSSTLKPAKLCAVGASESRKKASGEGEGLEAGSGVERKSARMTPRERAGGVAGGGSVKLVLAGGWSQCGQTREPTTKESQGLQDAEPAVFSESEPGATADGVEAAQDVALAADRQGGCGR
jgi:hypothetical protein